MQKDKDLLIEKWLNNTLSPKELVKFKDSDDYVLLSRIMESSTKLQAPNYDVDAAYVQLLQRKNKPKAKKWWQYSAAASVVLLIGFFAFNNFFSNATYTSDFGEQLVFNLPDGSKVTLNSKSSISFNERNWNKNRSLELSGEAFFDVEKGKKFTVNTQQGNVSVLGTEFTVHAQPNFFNVACFEGSVQVVDPNTNTTEMLTPTKGYQNIDETVVNYQFNDSSPSWLNNITTFKSVPLKYVLASLAKQYQLNFEYDNIDTSILFTGSFPNDNKKVALQTVLKSVQLNFNIQENRVILQK